jgi:hypothetical protein
MPTTSPLMLINAPPGVPWINRRVRLNLVWRAVSAPAPQGADDSGRDALADSERIADRYHVVAILEISPRSELPLRKSAGTNLQDRDIDARLSAEQSCLKSSLPNRDLDRARVLDDMPLVRMMPLAASTMTPDPA